MILFIYLFFCSLVHLRFISPACAIIFKLDLKYPDPVSSEMGLWNDINLSQQFKAAPINILYRQTINK